jgi:undecaprenyl-diphosphatase
MIFIKAAILAALEGITEFLPISSTGHMILVDRWMQLSTDQRFTDAFIVIIQLPAVLSVVVYFWKDLWPFPMDAAERLSRLRLWLKIMVATVPAAFFGFLLDDFIKGSLMNSALVVALALVVGGILLLLLERGRDRAAVMTARDIPFLMAFWIGMIQCIAMIPGTSRSAATIIGAMLLGAGRLAAAEFSFFLAIPTMLGATALTVLKDGVAFTPEQWAVLVFGSILSFVIAYAVVAGLMTYIRRHDFRPFGYYRIVLGAVIILYFLLAGISGK